LSLGQEAKTGLKKYVESDIKKVKKLAQHKALSVHNNHGTIFRNGASEQESYGNGKCIRLL
jgi:hypothetical protein